MTKQEFIKQYYGSASVISRMSFIPTTAILAQAAHESAWGNRAPGYNFFGMTAGGNYKGQRQLLKTTEYHPTRNVSYPCVISIVWNASVKAYQYTVRRYFRLYSNAFLAFRDYALNLLQNKRYEKAFKYYNDPVNFLTEIAKAGYATDPNYINKVLAVHAAILKELEYVDFHEA